MPRTLLPLLAVVLLFARGASGASYVDMKPLGRSTVGVALFGGAPAANSDERTSVIGGAGSELHYGYAWESGWSLAFVLGYARWSSSGPLAQTLRDRDAAIHEGTAGLSTRYVFGDGEIAPFVSSLLLLNVARVRGVYDGDAAGLATAARVGVRYREHPFELFSAVELRHARLSAPYDEADRMITTRISVVLGVALEGSAN